MAWHKHNIQTDYWICIKGSIKVGLATEDDGCEFEYLSDKNPRVLEIKPGIYHGSANAGINPKITIHWSGEIK